MDNHSLQTLKVLDELEKDSQLSQRALSKRLGVALGLTNLYIKRLIKKGYIRVRNIKKNRLIYELTPSGIAKKASLTLGYIQDSFEFYRQVRREAKTRFQELLNEGSRIVAFAGIGEIAEIAYLSLQESGLRLVAIVDDKMEGKEFLGYTVMSAHFLNSVRFDKVIVTSIESHGEISGNLADAGIPEEKIVYLDLG